MVVRQVQHLLQALFRTGCRQQCLLYTHRQKVKQDLDQLPCVDSASVGRETDLHTDRNLAVRRIYRAGTAFQYLLPRLADPHEAALAGAFCLKRILLDFCRHPPEQIVLKSDAPVLFPITALVKASHPARHNETHLGGSRKGIPLHMVDGQHILLELVLSPGVLVGRVTLVIDLSK